MSSRTESLFAAVHARPDDDTVRQVLADHLMEIGDERGELISLQLARAVSGAPPRRRERSLLAKHGGALCGRLAPLLAREGRVFERGFLVAGRAAGAWGFASRHAHTFDRYIGIAEWSTIEAFACPPPGSFTDDVQDAAAALFTHPVMRSLRVLHNVPIAVALAIAAADPAPPLVELGLDEDSKGVETLGATGLAGVRRLVLLGVGDPVDFLSIAECPLRARLESIALVGSFRTPVERLGTFVELLTRNAAPALRRIAMMANSRFPAEPEGWHVSIERDAAGRFTILEAALGHSTRRDGGHQLANALATLDRDALTAIRIRETREYKPTGEHHERLVAACRRFRNVVELSLPG